MARLQKRADLWGNPCINRNFSYDSEAYGQVQRNLHRLIETARLRPTRNPFPASTNQGSYLGEMSDKRLGTEDIEPATPQTGLLDDPTHARELIFASSLRV